MDELKVVAEKEKYYEDFAKEYADLNNKIRRNKESDLHKFKKEIKELLENEIVSRYYFQKGRIEASLKHDQEINKALELIKNKALYASILDGSKAELKK